MREMLSRTGAELTLVDGTGVATSIEGLVTELRALDGGGYLLAHG